MVKMRCLRDHSSMVWGSPVYGEEFEVADGYVDQLVSAGLAEPVKAGPAGKQTPDTKADKRK